MSLQISFSIISSTVFLSLNLVSAQAIPVSVESRLNPSTTVALAQPAQIEFNFSSDKKILVSTFSLPQIDDLNVTKVEILAPQKSSSNSWKTKVVLTFMPLHVGELVFPSFSIPYEISSKKIFSFQTPPFKMTVINPLQDKADLSMLKDIKPPVMANSFYFVWIVLIFILLTLVVFWIVKRKRKPALAENHIAVVSKPADEIAMEKLKLIFENYRKSGDFKTFYNDFSGIIRDYLHLRYEIDALEMTTSEIFSEMRRGAIERKICLQVKELLAASDLVKFAKAVPSEKQIETDFQKAMQLIDETKIIRPVTNQVMASAQK